MLHFPILIALTFHTTRTSLHDLKLLAYLTPAADLVALAEIEIPPKEVTIPTRLTTLACFASL